jgi:hypothetical protein
MASNQQNEAAKIQHLDIPPVNSHYSVISASTYIRIKCPGIQTLRIKAKATTAIFHWRFGD